MSTLRKIFYSFRFDDDVMRVQQIRNIGIIEDNKPVSINKWEEIKTGGEAAIKSWIDRNIDRAECVVVLIGENTHQSEWVKYEIRRAWDVGKGLVGIYIHNLKDPRIGICSKGLNPFEKIELTDGKMLSYYISVYNPDADAYNWIVSHIDKIIEKGIEARKK
jgi:hypothetical protein